MEELSYPCPCCCNLTFSTKNLLLDHLSQINENIICPMCKNSISSIENLISHLKYDNCVETTFVCKYSEDEKVVQKVEQNNVNYEVESNDSTQNQGYDTNSEDISEVTKIYSEFLNKQLVRNQEVKLLKESGNRYVLVTTNTDNITNTATLVSKQNNDGTVSFTIEGSKTPESTEIVETIENGMETKTEDAEATAYENSESVDEMYSCNTCGVSFASVMEHIQNYHNDQDVVVEEPLDDGTNGTISMEYQHDTEEEVTVEKQVSRRMITETGDIIEEPLQETEENEQVRLIIPLKKEPQTNSKNKKYVQVEELSNNVVKEITPDESNGLYHTVVVKTMQAPNGNTVKVYNCMSCNYLVSSLSEFKNHPCKRHKYPCPHCTVVYDNPKSLCAHMKVHKEKPVTFTCPLCAEVFEEPNSLCAHINEHKGNSETIAFAPVKYECEICSTKFPTSKSLKLHKRMHYPIKSRPIEPPVETKEGSYMCPVCLKLIPIDYKTIHQNSHKASSKMICDICNKKFSTKEYLEMHMNVHNIDKVTVGKQDSSLPYHCLYCNRKFARPHEKVKHERIHTGEKPHSCEICGKSFRVSYCLTLHMRTHTGARPYECPHCPKRFKAHSVYNHHLLTHSDVRGYKCPFCPKAFKTSVQLAGHKNSHTKPFACQQCNRPFASLYAVRVHMEVHSRQNNLKYACARCGASYARAFALRDHLRAAHPHENSGEETWTQSEQTETEEIETLNKDLPNEINEIEMNSTELIIS